MTSTCLRISQQPAYLVFEFISSLTSKHAKIQHLSIFIVFSISLFFIHYNPVSQSLTNIQRVLYFQQLSTIPLKKHQRLKVLQQKSLSLRVLPPEKITSSLKKYSHIHTSLCSCRSLPLSRYIYIVVSRPNP